ncbi:MAG: DNA polymerase III subunit alpha [Nitrospinae bacterium]|nr:DNA polymerase III subunit alpha [Nitrospinota bacterium]MZH05618.1 DNA polymerase III subunit alpha [Nitrospinota bacterium]MZH15112.1 DNA polymerase III subunit alpha [Nitrospinota bacterium]
MSNFVHLHLHTSYSLLDSSIRHEPLIKKAAEFGMPAVAMTDHGNMFGAVEFYNTAKKHGIKPILGCEVYVAPESRHEKKSKDNLRDASYHLILLSKNETGYKNLLRLITLGYLEGFYYKPRIDKELLAEHSEGLIALSSCIRGEVAHNVNRENVPRATKVAAQYAEIMGPDNFYLELQNHGLENQDRINREIAGIGKKLELPIVATNNCHYLNKEDFRAHEILLCLQTGKTINDPYRMQYPAPEFYFKSPKEMIELFKETPEAIENTLKIAERCELELEFDKLNLPDYPVPESYTLETYLEEISREGLKARFVELDRLGIDFDKSIYQQRLEEELGIIQRMGYPGYFLIVWDFIRHAKEKGIPVGPGRGSAAGSVVAYALKITDIDPLQYGLLFERFLNPERVSMPDIDIDFCMDGRDDVIKYVTEKYGGNQNVTQIITFGSMNAKGVIRDVGRVLDMTYGEVDKLAKLVPNKLNITLDDAFKEEKQFDKLRKENTKVAELLDIAKSLEGLQRHCSTHAAGVVISSKALTEFCPLYKGGNDEVVTQYAMGSVEKLGLLKMDFLGLRTLTVINNALRLIKQSQGKDLDISMIPLNDDETFKLLCDARTLGVFQLESSGMRDLLKKLKPDCFEDIIALLAMYRPGPLESGMVDDYVKRKHGTMELKFDLPQLRDILKETQGVILYQEQVMKIASVLAGFSLGDADLLRRAMGKKKPEEMAAQREKFMTGSEVNKIDLKKAEKIFDLMEKFAGYGFNKSHSAAYAQVSYQTAYLKAHYPLEFFGALITSDMDNTDKVLRYIHDCREMKITVQPPDVNLSDRDFSVSDNKLVFGLGAIKNVGSKAIDNIIEARKRLEKFKSLSQLCESVDLQLANKRVFESLIKSGACDSLGQSRAQMLKDLQASMEQGQAKQRDRQLGQSSMFDTFDEEISKENKNGNHVEEWSETDRLKFEKESIGFYITGHPLDRFTKDLSWFTDATSASVVESGSSKTVSIAGIPIKHLPKTTRKGDKMGIITLEDLHGSIEVILWPEIYAEVESILLAEEPILVKGEVDSEGNLPKVIAKEVFPLVQAKQRFQGRVMIHFRTLGLEKETLLAVKEILAANKGNNDTRLHFISPDNKERVVTVSDDLRIQPSDEVIEQIQSLLGEDAILFE